MKETAVIAAWSPPEWACCSFPLPEASPVCLEMPWLLEALNQLIEARTDADTTPLQRALHVAHMLVTMQGTDGAWPVRFCPRTGKQAGNGRTYAPALLMKQLKLVLQSTEFTVAVQHAEAHQRASSV